MKSEVTCAFFYLRLTNVYAFSRVTDEIKPQFAGHVVAVVERMPGQLFSGTLGLLRPSSAATKEKQEAERREREGDRVEEPKRGPIERPKIVWFKPTDKRVPLIAIPTEQAPPDFVQNSEAYANKLFVACIKRHVSLFITVLIRAAKLNECSLIAY